MGQSRRRWGGHAGGTACRGSRVRSQKSEVRSQKPEVRNQKSTEKVARTADLDLRPLTSDLRPLISDLGGHGGDELMRTRSFCLGLVLTAVMALAPKVARCQQNALPPDGVLPPPTVVRGQDYSPPDPVFPLPLYHERPETGGFYAAGEFLLMRQTIPLKEQPV